MLRRADLETCDRYEWEARVVRREGNWPVSRRCLGVAAKIALNGMRIRWDIKG